MLVRPTLIGSSNSLECYRVTVTIPNPGTYVMTGSAVDLGIVWADAGDHTVKVPTDIWNGFTVYTMPSLQSYVATSTDGPGAGLHQPVAVQFKIFGVDSAGADLYTMATAVLDPAELTDLTYAGWVTQPNGIRFGLGAANHATVIVPATLVLIGRPSRTAP